MIKITTRWGSEFIFNLSEVSGIHTKRLKEKCNDDSFVIEARIHHMNKERIDTLQLPEKECTRLIKTMLDIQDTKLHQ